jgi:hypothetical protein
MEVLHYSVNSTFKVTALMGLENLGPSPWKQVTAVCVIQFTSSEVMFQKSILILSSLYVSVSKFRIYKME